MKMSSPSRRAAYDLLTGKLAPYASEGDSIHFDRIVSAPVDDEMVGLVAQCLVDDDAEAARASSSSRVSRTRRRSVSSRSVRSCPASGSSSSTTRRPSGATR